MRPITRTATVAAAALLATVGAVAGAGSAQASTQYVSGDTVVAQLSVNEVGMANTWYQTLCAANIVPPVRGSTPFAFDTPECVSGLLHCMAYADYSRGLQVTYYSDHADCAAI